MKGREQKGNGECRKYKGKVGNRKVGIKRKEL